VLNPSRVKLCHVGTPPLFPTQMNFPLLLECYCLSPAYRDLSIVT